MTMVSHTTGAVACHQNNELCEGFRKIRGEAAGVIALNIVRPCDAPSLVAACLSGDLEATQLFRAVADTVHKIESAPRGKPMICGCCPRPLRGSRFTVCVAVPDRTDPTHGLGFALCQACGRDDDALPAKAAAALKSVWPDLRPITVTHGEGGHA
jgi:hypothetical protein